MVLSEAMRDFADYSRHELGHSPRTTLCYVSRLRHFARWLAEQGHPDPPVHALTPELIRRYSYSLSAQKHRPRTVPGALHALRALFAYLTRLGGIDSNPAQEVKLPKRDAATRWLVDDDALRQLMEEAALKQRSDFRCVRDRALLAVLVYSGLRRQELLDLTVSSVNIESRSLLVQQGKGRRSRVVPLCAEAVAPLSEWLAMRSKCR